MKHFSTGLRMSLLLLLLGAGCPKHRPLTPDEALERAYQTHSFIGLKSDPEKACPPIDGWQPKPLFSNPAKFPLAAPLAPQAPAIAANGEILPCLPGERTLEEVEKEMKRYCAYHRKAGRYDAKIPVRPVLGLSQIDRDPVALTVSAETLASKVQPHFAENFFRQVGRAGGALPINEDGPKVRLAFIDNHPSSVLTEEGTPVLNQGANGKICPSGHGDFLRLLGRKMTCENGRCATEITTRLALAYHRFDPETNKPTDRDDACGGSIGNFEDFAKAIDEEVNDLAGKEPRPPLILNLSLGWDGKKFGGLDADGQNVSYCKLPLGPRAVYDALQRARLLGALIFAAAGNDKLGPEPLADPLLPAAWERLSPREQAECPEVRNYPLVYAVGALQADGRALVSARRQGGMPSLAAYGDHAALVDPGLWPMKTYTGTSVSTAVVSSAAAMIWHQAPKITAAEVVGALLRSATPSLRTVDFRFPPTGNDDLHFPYAGRIWLCRALGGDDKSCPKPEPLVLSDVLSPTNLPQPALKSIQDCGQTIHFDQLDSTDKPCRWKEVADIASIPAVYPQPGNDPCPNCTDPPHRLLRTSAETNGHVLYIEIDPDWPSSKKLVSATFVLYSGQAAPSSRFISFAGSNQIGAEGTREVFLPENEFKFTAESQAAIHWVIQYQGNDHLFSSPVFIAN